MVDSGEMSGTDAPESTEIDVAALTRCIRFVEDHEHHQQKYLSAPDKARAVADVYASLMARPEYQEARRRVRAGEVEPEPHDSVLE